MSAPDNIGGDKSVTAKITHVKTSAMDGGGIKVAPVSVGGGNAGQQSQQQTTAAFRTIASSGQSTQVRVVMPPGTLMAQSMLKQIEGAGRTQITAMPARTVSNTSITVTRPVTQTTYLPRAGVTSTSMQGQRLVTPIRAQATPMAGLSGNFVRGTTVTRNTSSPATTVISPATTTWMANNGGQVQLIRAINHQPRQRLITQNISASGVSGGGNTGNVVAVSSQSQQQQSGNQSLQTVSSQQAFVATLATVLPRQQTATLVYTNVSNSQAQQYNPGVNATQRFAVAPLTNQRQIRPIPMNKSFSTAKLGVGMNTTSISIRAPNLPLVNTTVPGGSVNASSIGANVTSGIGTLQSRGSSGNASIPTTRIIQLQQQPGGTAQQIIGSTGRIANNLMLQPIIVNTAGGGKIGLRPPATMATKVQPSLTITQLGIGKLPPNAQQQTSSTASIQCASVSTAASVGNTNVATSSALGVQSNLTQQSQQQTVSVNSQSPLTQIVNVSQNIGGGATGQLMTTQNVSSSAATVVPLAITPRGSNVLTGTITPIKNSGLTVGKMMTQQSSHQSQSTGGSQSGQVTDMISATQQHHSQQQPTSVFIHHARPHSGGNASVVGSASGGSTTTVIPSTGTGFLPPGSTFYYESVPASSVSVSSGVLSLTTTTVTSSTMSSNQIVTSSNMAAGIVTSLPFNTPSSATFTVVPSSNRSIGQLQIPVSSTSAQIQAVPVRFSAQMPSEQVTVQQQVPSNQQTHHQIIIPSQASSQQSQQQQQQQMQQQSQGHMVIPLPTSIKVSAGASAVSAINSTAFLRKRDNDGSPIRAAKNLGPTLLSMGAASSNASSMSSQQMTSTISSSVTTDGKKEQRAVSPASSDGSTTVSANSSPGVDQQINEELTPVNRIPNESHFNPINDMYPNHQNSAPVAVRDHIGPVLPNQSHLNGAIECPPRKKSRRSTNDSQQSTQSHASSLPSLNPPASNSSQTSNVNGTTNSIPGTAPVAGGPSNEPPKVNNNNQNINSNKENTKPTEFVIRKPRTCTLLNSYKQNWKAANNHFQRHSDVKPREERRPTVMDLANQANVLGKINGWKVHHLKSQMEDLCESESKGYEKLTSMLKQMESHGKNPDIERISDLLKGNMQRSKIIVDGITEAQNQIMKIFDHKSHISDIIHRCASKRNFKKREKA
ncbi:mucin-19 [Eupeodes corollae]|uniref:mucin-19 n=1 Tax=Eupeodes corollae TaxID=290404 RepID=UPI002492D9B0|nr:mucin-19 [Eupeodes corollae]XP_055907201.1 mucin-19 [Eupeodes corollae]